MYLGYFYKGAIPQAAPAPAQQVQTVVRYVTQQTSAPAPVQSSQPYVRELETTSRASGGIDWNALAQSALQQQQPQVVYLEPEQSAAPATATATANSLTDRLPYAIAIGALALLAIVLLSRRKQR